MENEEEVSKENLDKSIDFNNENEGNANQSSNEDLVEDLEVDPIVENEQVEEVIEEVVENNDEIEEVLEDNDTLLEKDYLATFVEQDDRVVYYEIENIYKGEKGREYRKPHDLRRNPPILVIKDNLGAEVELILTKNFTRELIAGLKEVDRAYLGFTEPADLNAPDKPLDKMVYYIKKNPIKAAFPVVIIIIGIVLSIL